MGSTDLITLAIHNICSASSLLHRLIMDAYRSRRPGMLGPMENTAYMLYGGVLLHDLALRKRNP